ncbi:hypothetical protein PVA45_05345 [Entomospira entomophila]|uniref:Uncharacterized protein n=1 Tax=Entomospira entomophila TaxID=2719988 RepID=A0A968GED6_9SPIO|nr:hypothetical protein [Entomospira entomophilus]NIZ40924.1 hypothetical protein [Entomospira entomophilus]WDI35137.1 hypothetical protein PVA45_05345 [Entomospira entomophilus]
MNLYDIMDKLAKTRPIFHSEADFQFALAWQIQQTHPDADIRLEYPTQFEIQDNGEKRRGEVDIIVAIDGLTYPIELKYKTAELSTEIDHEKFQLKNQSAQNYAKYDFYKDMRRIELLSKAWHEEIQENKRFETGYAIFLTNHQYYWKTKTASDCKSEQFNIVDDMETPTYMQWKGTETSLSRQSAIQLMDTYYLKWKTYSEIMPSNDQNIKMKNHHFQYLLVEIPPRSV